MILFLYIKTYFYFNIFEWKYIYWTQINPFIF